VDRVDHIAIPVTDISAAVGWYKNNFICEVAYEDDTWAMLQFSNIKLALVIPEEHPSHFAIERNDAAKFGKLTSHRDGSASVYIKDPWDNCAEIMKSNEVI